MRSSSLGFLALAALAILATPTASGAANIFIQWGGPTSSGGVIRDPVFATNTVGGSFIEADLASGVFKGSAFHDGALQNAIATVAYSGIENLIFTNTTAVPVMFGGSYPFELDLDATFSHSVDALGVGSWATQLVAQLLVTVQGQPLRQAQIALNSAENWNNGLQASAFDITPTELNGGSVTVNTGTVGALDVTLSMGMITLGPGETMMVGLLLAPIAIAFGDGFSATTDMASTARLRLVLPAGVSLSSDASVPLAWVVNDDDIDGVPDAADNCPHFANANQSDIGGIGAASVSDGIGDACQCGDVSGNGRVTSADAILITRSLLAPPTAVLTRPDLCDVGGSAACTTADAVIVTRALLVPPTATVSQVCPPSLP